MSADYFYITSSRTEPWNPHPPISEDDVITTGDVNPFFNFFLSANLPTQLVNNGGTEEQWSWMRFLGAIRNGDMQTGMSQQDIATRGHYLAMHFCKYTRELIWESVRREHFPDKPSRQKCLWVSQGEENLNYWISQLGLGGNQAVFRVELDGVLHEASDEHLMNDDIPYDLALEKAHKYWSGEITNPLAKEILFEGNMQILERVS
ncbi:DUF2441 domain-containing protein [Scandinavium sp. TWS1a]|uniref:DUF2441 domain-containing protein n=1 Tax=Scandinavium tedordense TaxID=2926521 RepID=UPI002166B5AA|nr:DUF2441 domain-containing protein [Scandinavium tedordense]MCS2172789.1 DUF2441 domain-containing protein [Scandinavium tedordense]